MNVCFSILPSKDTKNSILNECILWQTEIFQFLKRLEHSRKSFVHHEVTSVKIQFFEIRRPLQQG
jgi:hypothetical protein